MHLACKPVGGHEWVGS